MRLSICFVYYLFVSLIRELLMPPPCRIELLGTLRICRKHQITSRFRSQQIAGLLAYLALFPDTPHRREALVEHFWPKAVEEKGRLSLRVALNQLRQLLTTGDTDNNPLRTDREHIQLDMTRCDTDVRRFERLLLQARSTASAEEANALRAQAVQDYVGDLLPDRTEFWVLGERNRLADLHLLALRRLVEYTVRAGDLDAALAYAHRAVDADPLREESTRVLMRLYAGMDRPRAVRQHYDALATALREQLNANPSPQTIALLQQLLGSAMPPEVASDTPVPPSVSSLPETAHSPTPALGDLPVPTDPLVGREQELDALCTRLDNPYVRLVTVTGFGGVGKTRLALAAARRLAPRFSGGAWFVPLADVFEPMAIFTAIADALRLKRRSRVPLEVQLETALNAAPCLLLLDNFEQLATDGARIVQRLLERCPSLVCLVTSRQRLRLAGEWVHPVATLPTPDALPPGMEANQTSLLRSIATSPSVQVFVTRARAASGAFTLTADNAHAVATICRALDGLPLALEIAAAWTPLLTTAQLAAQLVPQSGAPSRASALDGSGLKATGAVRHARQASLDATLEWSVRLLPERAKRLFAQLAVFRGGFTLEAIKAVVPDSDVMTSLLDLQAHSLLSVQAQDATPRYAYLDLVRGYAASLLASDSDAAIETQSAHAAYYLAQAEETAPDLQGPGIQEAMQRLVAERLNFYAALEWLLSSTDSDDLGRAFRICGALCRFWAIRGEFAEGTAWLARLRARKDELTPAQQMSLSGQAGNLAYYAGENGNAKMHFTHAWELAHALGDVRREAMALDSLGAACKSLGDFLAARRHGEAAATLFAQLDDRVGKASCQVNLASLAGVEDDLPRARFLSAQARIVFQERQDWFHVAFVANSLASAEVAAGEWEAARTLVREGLVLCSMIDSVLLHANLLDTAASVRAQDGDPTAAAALLAYANHLRIEYFLGRDLTEQARCDALIIHLQQILEPDAFWEATAWGERLTLSQALALAQPSEVIPLPIR